MDDDECPHGLGMRIACTICLGKLPKARKGGGRPWWGGDSGSNVTLRWDDIPASGRDLSRVIEREYAPSWRDEKFAPKTRTHGEWTPATARFTRGAPSTVYVPNGRGK